MRSTTGDGSQYHAPSGAPLCGIAVVVMAKSGHLAIMTTELSRSERLMPQRRRHKNLRVALECSSKNIPHLTRMEQAAILSEWDVYGDAMKR